VEFGKYGDPRQMSPLATTYSVLLDDGGYPGNMRGLNLALIAPTTGYFYSGETVTTGFYVGGTQVKLCKKGCRPGLRQQLYRFTNSSYSGVTKYINTFADGEMWVSDAPDVRTGAKLSKKLADWNTSEALPCGMLYSVCCLVGAGGGGGAAGLLVGYDNNGSITVSAPIEVIIQHSGAMDDAAAVRFGKKVAETSIGSICEAFRKKGIHAGGGNGALKPQ
jgi:hypothetical protein